MKDSLKKKRFVGVTSEEQSMRGLWQRCWMERKEGKKKWWGKSLYTNPGGGGRGEPLHRAGTQWTALEAPTMVGQHPSTSMVFYQPPGNPSPATLFTSKKCTALTASPAARLFAISTFPSANSRGFFCAVRIVSPLFCAVVIVIFSLTSIGF